MWIGEGPVPGSPETLAALLAAGKEIAFVTNNPGRTPDSYAERLAGLGVEVAAQRIVTAGVVSARLAAQAAEPGAGAFVIGSKTLKGMISEAGLAVLEGEAGLEASVVVVSGYRGFDYDQLHTATMALARARADRHQPRPDAADARRLLARVRCDPRRGRNRV